MRGLLKVSLSLSLLADRQTKELFFFSSIKLERAEQVEVRCGHTVEVVLNYFNHAPQKKLRTFFPINSLVGKSQKATHTHKQLPTVPDKPAVVVRK